MNRCRKTEGKRPLGFLRHEWEDNIKMDLKQIGCDEVDSIYVAQDRAVVNMVMNSWITQKVENLLTSYSMDVVNICKCSV
jgi:aspartate carbamoyltransferase regulatory subunit